MSLRRRGSSWVVSLVLPGYPRIRKSFRDPAVAAEYETKCVARSQLGLPLEDATNSTESAPTLLWDLMDRTYKRYWVGQKSEESNLCSIRIVQQVMGKDTPIKSINNASIDDFVSKLRTRGGHGAAGLTGSTVNRKLACLSKALRYAEKMGWIVKAPMIERAKENKHRLRWITKAEELELQAAYTFVGETELKDLQTFLLDTGCRLSEVINLKVEQCDLGGRLIHLWGGTTKTGLARSVPITRRVWDIIERRSAGMTLFPTLSADIAIKRFNKAKALTSMRGDKYVILHTMRHTFASRLAQAGVPIPTIASLLGHTSIQMTMRYAHLAPANLAAAVAVLDQISNAA